MEDNDERLAQFKAAVAELGDYHVRSWRDAGRMIAECHEALADVALISLDHDLNKEHDHSPDPGDGVQVATFLGKLPPICPVILHTSNGERVWSMHNEVRFGGWTAERVMPLGDDWIKKSWLPKARALLKSPVDSKLLRPEKFSDQKERLARAITSLYGVSFGDAIGEMMNGRPEKAHARIMEDALPSGPWFHTDDTEMAISIVEVLRLLGSANSDALARQFAWRFERQPDRGYGSGARRLLRSILDGAEWRVAAGNAFDGHGSLGNGSAMRVTPIGAFFADDLDRVAKEAHNSAIVTHMHPEGIAGAIAVAIAAAVAWRLRGKPAEQASVELFDEVHKHTPDGEVRRGIAHAFKIRHFEKAEGAARLLGNGSRITCPDTVPFTIWAAAKYLGRFREAIAETASAGGDIDTNCAIVGGIVALSAEFNSIPKDWINEMEPLPYPVPASTS